MSEREDLVRRLQAALEAVISRFGHRYTATMPEHSDLCQLDDAVKEAATYIASSADYVRGLEDALYDIADGPQPIESYKFGIRCGIEDCDLQSSDAYTASEYGYEQGLDWCADIATRALKHKAQAEESSAPQVGQPEKDARSDHAQPAAADDQNAAGRTTTATSGSSATESAVTVLAAPVADPQALNGAHATGANADAVVSSQQGPARSASVMVPRAIADAAARKLALIGKIYAGDKEARTLAAAMLSDAPAPVVDEEAVNNAREMLKWDAHDDWKLVAIELLRLDALAKGE